MSHDQMYENLQHFKKHSMNKLIKRCSWSWVICHGEQKVKPSKLLSYLHRN